MVGTQLTMLEAPRARAPGEVFTQRWVVDLILDLVGYGTECDPAELRLLEPACGTGAFLVPVVDRLLTAVGPDGVAGADAAITALDLVEANVRVARREVAARLVAGGVPHDQAAQLARRWIRQGDFLLEDAEDVHDVIVGNPPYVRIEDVDTARLRAYRERHPTMRGRSDLYVAFLERGLRRLAAGGRLGVICADRWMHNAYGAALRAFVGQGYTVDTILKLHDVDAFDDDVAAYPAVTVVANEARDAAVVGDAASSFDPASARAFRDWREGGTATIHTDDFRAARVPDWPRDGALWPSGNPAAVSLVRELERRCPRLEDAPGGARVGIGVATGADDVFLVRGEQDVEPERLLPVARPSDLRDGTLAWSGTRLVNPWARDGLVDLDSTPRMAAYLARHGRRLRSRYVARQQPHAWYRTIDRVWPDLATTPKLLLPDMKSRAHPVLDEGTVYPDHNLYYVVGEDWDLRVLGGLLLSDVANLFIATYCVKMRGGTYRFQAQYLRTIRIPPALSPSVRQQLRDAFDQRSRDDATRAACRAYDIDPRRLARALA